MTKILLLTLCLFCVVSCTTSPNSEKSAVLMEDDEETTDEVDDDLADDELGEEVASGALEVSDLRYVAGRNGGTIVIRTTGKAAYRLREEAGQKQFVLEIANANLPARLRRPYITQEFNQAVSAINAYQEGGTTARVVVQMRSDDRLRVEQRGNEIFLAPESTSGSDSIAISAAEIEESSAPGAAGSSAPRDGLPLSGLSMDDLNGAGSRFYGKPISIEVRDTNIRDVISFIAEQSGANLVVSDEVNGAVTIKLKQVPWDQALLLVMKSKQLGYVRQGNVLRIAGLDILQKETESARKVVEAQRAAQPLRVRVIPVSYAKVEELVNQVKEFLSAGRGKVVGDVRTSSIIVTDIIENIERITNLVKALDIPPLQVQIEAKVVEATEGFTRSIGVEWRASGNPANIGGAISVRPSIGMNRGTANRGSFDGRLTIGTLDLLGSLEATLGLFEQENQAKIISAPSVVTINNETANIIQSQDIFIPSVSSTGGTSTTGFSKNPVKLELKVTPQITSSSDVLMNVEITRQFLGAVVDPRSPPPINNREAKTRVMVGNGQTAVIGGVYQNDTSHAETGVPWLRSLPVLGVLFRSTNKTEAKNELLVFITPRILNASEGAIKRSEL